MPQKAARKKSGYQRSPYLTGNGVSLHFWKAALSAKSRKVSLGNKAVNLAVRCNFYLTEVEDVTKQQIRRKVREAHGLLWEAQKEVTQKHVEWLKKNAQHRVLTEHHIDWIGPRR